jgi:putative tricarboxylic transport membrane protein
MLMANGIHLIIGKLGIPVWAWVAKSPRALILPVVFILCMVGVYLPGQSMFDIGVMLAFAGIGLAMRRTGFSVVCLVIGFLLGGMFEISLRQSMLLYKSDIFAIIDSPISMVFLLLTLFILMRASIKGIRNGRG